MGHPHNISLSSLSVLTFCFLGLQDSCSADNFEASLFTYSIFWHALKAPIKLATPRGQSWPWSRGGQISESEASLDYKEKPCKLVPSYAPYLLCFTFRYTTSPFLPSIFDIVYCPSRNMLPTGGYSWLSTWLTRKVPRRLVEHLLEHRECF